MNYIIKHIMKIVHNSMVLASLFILVACSESESDGPMANKDFIKVEGKVDIGADETSKTLVVEANCHWDLTLENAWEGLNVTPKEGEGNEKMSSPTTVTIQTPRNLTTEDRIATILIKSRGGVSKRIDLKQLAGNKTLVLSDNSHLFESTGGKWSFTISSNTSWTITGSATGFSYDKNSGTGNATIEVIAEENKSEDDRKLVLTISAGSEKRDVTITQKGKVVVFEVTPKEMTSVSALGTTETIHVTGNVSWAASSNKDWVKLSTTEGDGNSDVTITINPNYTTQPLEATLSFTANDKNKTQREVTIKQNAGAVPVIERPVARDRTRTTATIEGSISSEFPLTSASIIFSAEQDPKNVSEASSIEIKPTKVGDSYTFSVGLEGLSDGTYYYLRVKAVNAVGTGYSEVLDFTTTGRTPGGGDNPQPEWIKRK